LSIDVVGFVLEVIAVGLGVFLAFWADSYRENRSEKKHTLRVLAMLKNELQRNFDAIEIIRRNLEKGLIPYEHFKADCWDAVADKLSLVQDDELLRMIMRVYYNFDTFERTIKLLYEEVFALHTESNEEVKKRLFDLVRERREVLLKHITVSRDSKDITSLTNAAISGIDNLLRS
jgi:hypothetical protein